MQDLRHRLFSLQNHFTAPNMLMAAALVAGLLLAALLVQKALHRQVCFLLLYHITSRQHFPAVLFLDTLTHFALMLSLDQQVHH